MEKLFTVVGSSILNGTFSYRVANNINRSKVLIRNGHKQVDLITLPEPMTKSDAIAYYRHSQQTPVADTGRDERGRFTKQGFRFLAA